MRPQVVVATCPHCSSLYLLWLHLHLTLPPALPEVVEEVHQPKLCYQFSNLLAARVLGFADVGAEVSYHYGISVSEVWNGPIQVR